MPTVNHFPSSIEHAARALAHDNIVDRVLNCEHERTTLIGVLFLVLVDCSVSVPRISRPTVTRIVTLLSTRATGFVRGLCRAFIPCLRSLPWPVLLPVPFPWPLSLLLPSREMWSNVHRTCSIVQQHCLGFGFRSFPTANLLFKFRQDWVTIRNWLNLPSNC